MKPTHWSSYHEYTEYEAEMERRELHRERRQTGTNDEMLKQIRERDRRRKEAYERVMSRYPWPDRLCIWSVFPNQSGGWSWYGKFYPPRTEMLLEADSFEDMLQRLEAYMKAFAPET